MLPSLTLKLVLKHSPFTLLAPAAWDCDGLLIFSAVMTTSGSTSSDGIAGFCLYLHKFEDEGGDAGQVQQGEMGLEMVSEFSEEGSMATKGGDLGIMSLRDEEVENGVVV
ncbi:hypothetical protein PAXRUDRAFT_29235 [Paxillus rubicundulus Ve08.2h10]|uniref:Uncharacterized protein n=1 Tax=Paxillus rubicundulus Ve08.2h10 TaxID=930991 RepID=A0A0D0D929_9AGAM|nr:hypothetical protein PAXRUDRAFT_29235 [Paxillus rubicundulus Ve08.2h10]